jgi:hypothetical protein
MNRRQYIKDAASVKKFPGPGTYEALSDFPIDVEDYKVSTSRMNATEKTTTLPKIESAKPQVTAKPEKTDEKKEPPKGS